jgi:hypothetical protein
MWHYYTPPSTSKPCGATRSTTCMFAISRSGTWSSDEIKVARTATSSHPRGRSRSSSNKCSDPRHTRSNTKKVELSPTRGTSNTCGHFTLE